MKFVCLVYADDADPPTAAAARPEGAACLLHRSLHGVDTATTLRVRHGRVSLADGPAVDTVPALAQVYVIDVADEPAAIRWAASLPEAARGSVEVRPARDLLAE